MFSRLSANGKDSSQTSRNLEVPDDVMATLNSARETFSQEFRAQQMAAQLPQRVPIDTNTGGLPLNGQNTAGQTGGQSIGEQQNGQTLPRMNLNQGLGGFQVYTNAN